MAKKKKRRKRGPELSLERAGVPMQEALTPQQCEKMKLFLRVLTTIHNRNDVKIPIGKFMTAWNKYMIQETLIRNNVISR